MSWIDHGEDRLNLVLEATRVGLWDWNVQTGETVFSERWADIAGYTLKELAPVSIETWAQLVHPDDRAQSEELLRRHFSGEISYYECECRMRHKDGHWVWVLDRGMVVESTEDGAPLRMTGTHADITERKQAEAALQYQTSLLSSLVDSIPDIVFFKDVDGVYLGCNPPFCEFTGMLREKIIGQTDYEFFNRETADFFREQDRVMLDQRSARHNEERVTYPDGRKVLLDTLKAPLTLESGEVIGLLGVSRDITARKNAEEELALRESYLSAIIENLPGLVWMKDDDSRFLAVNRAFAQSCGLKTADLEGKTDLDIWPEDLAELYRSDDLKVMQASAPVITEEPIADQGERRWFETFKTPVVDERGDVIGTVGYSQDITERKQSREQIERLNTIQAELVRLATGFVNIPIARKDEAIDEALRIIGGLIDACRAYLFCYDFEAGVMSNTHEWCAERVAAEKDNLQNVPLDLFPGWVSAHRRGDEYFVPDVQQLEPGDILRDVLEPQGIQSLITLPLMNGEECLGFVGFDAVRDHRAWGHGEIQLLSVMAEMLANLEIKRRATLKMEALNQKLRAARDKAEAAAEAKAMFLANMSHEIRTPLNAVLGHAQIMQRNAQGCSPEHFPKNFFSSLDAISRSGEHLLALVNDILELIKMDEREVSISLSVFDFHQILESAKTICSQRKSNQVALEIVLAPDVPQMLEGDKGKIRQVLINLIGNSLKFTKEGSVTVSVNLLSPGKDMMTVCVDVADTGYGIEEEAREAVFIPFEQSESGKAIKSGTGLGLPLCRRYARAMGGDVKVLSSAIGKGAVFRFLFRARPVENAGGDAVVPREAPVSAPESAIRLDGVTHDFCQNLLHAVQHGDVYQMRRMVGQLEGDCPDAAEGLGRLIRRYDYTRLTQLLQDKIKGEEQNG